MTPDPNEEDRDEFGEDDSASSGSEEAEWDESLQRRIINIDRLEDEWAEQLESASLVVQVQYRDSDAEAALRRIGYFFKTKQTQRVSREYPAAFLVGLNFVASSQMQQATLWPYVFAGLGDLKASESNKDLISRLHRLALNKFRLERFEHPLGRIGEIQIHAGIPVSSQEKFVRKLIREFKREIDFDHLSFNESIRSMGGDRVAAASLDKQIWHFINQGGNVADDFVAKCIEILDDPDNPNSGKGLPARVSAEVASLVEELGKSGVSRAGKSSGRIKAPRLVWSKSIENELELVFPTLPEAQRSSVRWTVESGDQLATVDVAQELAGLSRKERSYPVSSPTAQLTTQFEYLAPGSNFFNPEYRTRTWNLTLFAEELPVLFFDDEGQLDGGKGPLEPGLIRVLVPKKTRLGPGKPIVRVEGRHKLRELDAPLGWGVEQVGSEWFALEIDCKEAEAIEVDFGSNRPFRRAISAFRKPKPLLNGLVAGVFDPHGSPVFSEFPAFEVGSLALDDDEWQYEIRDLENKPVWSAIARAKSGQIAVVPPSHLLGEFNIRVSRGFGQTTTINRTVVPDLSSDYDGGLRKFRADGKGLGEAEFTVARGDAGLLPIHFDSQIRAVALELDDSDIKLTARAEYEYLELFNTRSKNHTEWIEPTKSNVENLTELQLFFSSQVSRSAALIARWPNGTTQTLTPRVSSPWFKFNLGELSDQANAQGSFSLELRDNLGRLLPAGTCYPKKLYNDVELDDNSQFLKFSFPKGNRPDGLQLAIYSPLAPWRSPFVVDLDSDTIEIPEELRSLSQIAGSVAVSSPWAPHDFGRTPNYDSSNTFVFEVQSPDWTKSPELALVHWIETGRTSNQLQLIGAELAWTCFLGAEELFAPLGVNTNEIKSLAIKVLQSTENSLDNYPSSKRTRAESVVDLIESGFVAKAASTTMAGALNQVGRPLLAIIGCALDDSETAEDLLNLAPASWGVSNPKATEEQPSMLETLRYKLDLLNFRKPEVLWMIRVEEHFFANQSEGYLPGRLLDGGNVFLNVFRVLYQDVEKLITGLGNDWAVETASALLAKDGLAPEGLKQLLAARPILSTSELKEIAGLRSRLANWPGISLRMAVLARLAARGNEEARSTYEANKVFYLKMAKALPTLVEIDLTIAELALRETESAR
jgi:hypothetical protein